MQHKYYFTATTVLLFCLILTLSTVGLVSCKKAKEESSSKQNSSDISGATVVSTVTTQGTQNTQSLQHTTNTSSAIENNTQTTKINKDTQSTPSTQNTQKTTAATTTVPRKEITVTIPEGYSFQQIANLLEAKNICTAKAFYTTCQNYSPASFSIPVSADRCFKMEGYLFPDTYRFYEKDNPVNVLVKMLNNYRQQVGNLSDSTLILASLIEKEARTDANMKLVSSVFHNRLNNSAAYPYLDADPTREYVNNFITGNALLTSTGKYAALYNTCGKRKGLPAGPICSPGLRAIHAATNPADTDYFFFFYGKDNQNHYSKTYAEHQAAMEKYGIG